MSLFDSLSNPGAGSLGAEPGSQECSRASCRSTAVFSIGWRNPKIHAEDRVKVWVACDEHVDFLREFLAARDFPLTVTLLAGGAVPDARADAPRSGPA